MNAWENALNQNQMARPAMPQTTNQMNQFMWVNGRSMVDAWPIAANGQMTFIDPDAMKLWIKKADAYGRPFNAEEYDIVPVKTEEVKNTDVTSAVTEERVHEMISQEVEKAVSAKISSIFSVKEEGHD